MMVKPWFSIRDVKRCRPAFIERYRYQVTQPLYGQFKRIKRAVNESFQWDFPARRRREDLRTRMIKLAQVSGQRSEILFFVLYQC